MERRIAAFYVTSLDRVGLALGAGGLLSGFVVMLLMATGGQRDPVALGLGWLLGAIFAMLGIVAVAGPVWVALHFAGRRGPVAAALTAAAVAMLLLAGGQTGGLGAFAPPGDAATGYRWISAIATGLLVAVAAAAIGWAMQKIAYRRLM